MLRHTALARTRQPGGLLRDGPAPGRAVTFHQEYHSHVEHGELDLDAAAWRLEQQLTSRFGG